MWDSQLKALSNIVALKSLASKNWSLVCNCSERLYSDRNEENPAPQGCISGGGSSGVGVYSLDLNKYNLVESTPKKWHKREWSLWGYHFRDNIRTRSTSFPPLSIWLRAWLYAYFPPFISILSPVFLSFRLWALWGRELSHSVILKTTWRNSCLIYCI